MKNSEKILAMRIPVRLLQKDDMIQIFIGDKLIEQGIIKKHRVRTEFIHNNIHYSLDMQGLDDEI